MDGSRRGILFGLGQRSLVAAVILVAVAVFLMTWVGIKESRSDSFQLLRLQGAAFTEALAQASANAIAAESFYERLVHRRYNDLVRMLQLDDRIPSQAEINRICEMYDLRAIYVIDRESNLLLTGSPVGNPPMPDSVLLDEADRLFDNQELRYSLVLDSDADSLVVQYYAELTDQLDKVVLIASDGRAYVDALNQTGIGILAQRMAGEKEVEYIIYQTPEGIVFSSTEAARLEAIESDPFLTTALEADSISSRVYKFNNTEVLELVRPFSSRKYPFGLFRVGISLERYFAIARGYDRQMLALAGILFLMVTAVMLYLQSRRRGAEISREYSAMKTLTDRIFEQMQVGVLVIGQDGAIRLANDALQHTLGAPVTVGATIELFPVLVPLRISNIRESRQSAGQFEVGIEDARGPKTLLVAWSKVGAEDEEGAALAMVISDVTQLRQYEQESSRRERLSEMGNLAAGVAHEIRNPLNAISIAAQRLAGEFAVDQNADEYQRMTQQIRAETQRLNGIITRFLALAREGKPRKIRFALSSAVEDFCTLVGSEANRLGIKIRVDIPSDLMLTGDPEKMRELLTNLYNNAKEALAERPGQIRVSGAAENSGAVLIVEDSGPGIPAPLREKVFTPYFTTKEAGTGLGLPTVHRIVTDLGGAIEIADSSLGGARFRITLPAGGQ